MRNLSMLCWIPPRNLCVLPLHTVSILWPSRASQVYCVPTKSASFLSFGQIVWRPYLNTYQPGHHPSVLYYNFVIFCHNQTTTIDILSCLRLLAVLVRVQIQNKYVWYHLKFQLLFCFTPQHFIAATLYLGFRIKTPTLIAPLLRLLGGEEVHEVLTSGWIIRRNLCCWKWGTISSTK